MKFVEDVMDMPMPKTDDKNFGKVLQIKQQVSQSLLTVTTRVQAGLLRPTEDDGMAEVFAAMRAAKEQLNEDVDIFS